MGEKRTQFNFTCLRRKELSVSHGEEAHRGRACDDDEDSVVAMHRLVVALAHHKSQGDYSASKIIISGAHMMEAPSGMLFTMRNVTLHLNHLLVKTTSAEISAIRTPIITSSVFVCQISLLLFPFAPFERSAPLGVMTCSRLKMKGPHNSGRILDPPTFHLTPFCKIMPSSLMPAASATL